MGYDQIEDLSARFLKRKDGVLFGRTLILKAVGFQQSETYSEWPKVFLPIFLL